MSDLVEKVAQAILWPGVEDLTGWQTWEPEARAAIAVVLKDQYKKMPTEMYGPPMYYLREYARENGIDLNGAGSESRGASLNCEPSGHARENGLKPQTDIVERLRAMWSNSVLMNCEHGLLNEAADEIERQAAEIDVKSRFLKEAQAEIERLREALTEIEALMSSGPNATKIARAALNEHPAQPSDDPAKT